MPCVRSDLILNLWQKFFHHRWNIFIGICGNDRRHGKIVFLHDGSNKRMEVCERFGILIRTETVQFITEFISKHFKSSGWNTLETMIKIRWSYISDLQLLESTPLHCWNPSPKYRNRADLHKLEDQRNPLHYIHVHALR